MMNLAIIPARGGSKRIPRKNIRNFLGKPIIAYSIDIALQSGLFDEIIVSTDDIEIAEIAIKFGAKVPFMRPKEISDDFTGTLPVIKHAIISYEQEGKPVDNVCCIYPTAPLLKSKYLQEAFDKLNHNLDIEFVFSASEFEYNIFRSFDLQNDRVNMFWPDNYHKRSQDLPHAMFDAGQFYLGRKMSFLTKDILFDKYSSTIHIPRYLVQDIDNLDDWYRAEMLYKIIHYDE